MPVAGAHHYSGKRLNFLLYASVAKYYGRFEGN